MTLHLDAVGQVPEIPARYLQAVPGSGGEIGEGFLGAFAQILADALKVAAQRHRSAGFIDNAEVHLQMFGDRIGLKIEGANRQSAALAEIRRDGIYQRSIAGLERGGGRAGYLRHGDEIRAQLPR